MSEILDDPRARAQVNDDVFRLVEAFPEDATIDSIDLAHFARMRLSGRSDELYSDNRTKADVAVKLGVTATQLSKALHGQRILDIGSGKGAFAGDVAKDKSTHVVALDTDPSVLSEVPNRPNITAIEGDGYDLLGSGLQSHSFDSVFVTYATNFWASSEDEVMNSILEPLKVLKPGGSLYLTPIAQNLGIIDAKLRGLLPEPLVTDIEQDGYRYSKVYGLFALRAFALANALEETGKIKAAYRASNKNGRMAKKQLSDGRSISPDSYSVILTSDI